MDELIQLFNENHIRYLVFGGQAVRLEGMPRFSMDWDLFIPGKDAENMRRINELLADELDLPLVPLGPRGENLIQTYQTRWGIVQFHLSVAGIRAFDEAEARIISDLMTHNPEHLKFDMDRERTIALYNPDIIARVKQQGFHGYEMVLYAAVTSFETDIHIVSRKSDNKCFAIKQFHLSDEHYVRMCRNEMELTDVCQGPGVIEIDRSASSFGGEVNYLVLEWIYGDTLLELAFENMPHPITVNKVLDYGTDLLSAVDCVHRAGVLHRDIRPHNIMISRSSGRVKLIDFGISCRLKDVSQVLVAGDSMFVSPEHDRPENLCVQSDLFCVGLILYMMLSLSFPYNYRAIPPQFRTVSSMAELMRKHRATPLSYYCSDIPADLEAVVMKSLSQNPQDRFSSADEFETALMKVWVHVLSSGQKASGVAVTNPFDRVDSVSVNEKRIGTSELEEMLMLILCEIFVNKTVYIVQPDLLCPAMVEEFVLGPESICGAFLGLVDEEYGWPVPIDVKNVTSVVSLAPFCRRHPFIFYEDKCLAVGIQRNEYEMIKKLGRKRYRSA